jgi:hypothetical protein
MPDQGIRESHARRPGTDDQVVSLELTFHRRH